MATPATTAAAIALLLLYSLTLLITPSSACSTCPKPKPPPSCPPPPSKTPTTKPPPSKTPTTKPPPAKSPPSPPATATPPSPAAGQTCPIDTLKLEACVDVLGGLVHAVIGGTTSRDCCSLIKGLAGLDAAVCLCTAIKAKVLDISIVLPVALEVLAGCGKSAPSGFNCPS